MLENSVPRLLMDLSVTEWPSPYTRRLTATSSSCSGSAAAQAPKVVSVTARLPSATNRSLSALDLFNNAAGAVGAKALVAALQDDGGNRVLTDLKLGGCGEEEAAGSWGAAGADIDASVKRLLRRNCKAAAAVAGSADSGSDSDSDTNDL